MRRLSGSRNSSVRSDSLTCWGLLAMARKRSGRTTFFFMSLVSIATFTLFAPLPSLSYLSPPVSATSRGVRVNAQKFEIKNDMFWRDGQPFRIIGGDLHYFRVLPEYWEDRLLRAKALGLNTIQTYVPWNLHEPRSGELVFEGIADIVAFLKLCQKLDFLVMLRPGPYICAEWDLGGFPPWLLDIDPPLRLRSSDPAFLQLVDRWWGKLLPKIAPLLYDNGGPIVMVQIENEYGSYGDDKAYLHHLVAVARRHLGHDVILYTTDGGSRETLEKGTIRGDTVFSAVDFPTGYDPQPIFKLQKQFNAPGKSPPLCAEFYTGWLTHWGEKIANTGAEFTGAALEKILSLNGSAVLYMAHGGTNFGFYNGANTGEHEFEYKPDLTSYDYDAPIRESGDVDNVKFKALRTVVMQYNTASLPSVPPNNEKRGYGPIQLQRTFLFDLLDKINHIAVVNSENPTSMETVGQMFGFLLYTSRYAAKDEGSTLSIPNVHDRAQVFISCPSEDNGGRPTYVGVIERWSNQDLSLPDTKCASKISLFILVENMGRVNYGPHIFDKKGILSPVYLDGHVLKSWKMIKIPFKNLSEVLDINPVTQVVAHPIINKTSGLTALKDDAENFSIEPAFYTGSFMVDEVKDTFISFSGWGKGIAFVNEFNLGRYWPSVGPQCNLYVPAPVLKRGENTLIGRREAILGSYYFQQLLINWPSSQAIFELESPNPKLVVHSVKHADFTCGSTSSGRHQL